MKITLYFWGATADGRKALTFSFGRHCARMMVRLDAKEIGRQLRARRSDVKEIERQLWGAVLHRARRLVNAIFEDRTRTRDHRGTSSSASSGGKSGRRGKTKTAESSARGRGETAAIGSSSGRSSTMDENSEYPEQEVEDLRHADLHELRGPWALSLSSKGVAGPKGEMTWMEVLGDRDPTCPCSLCKAERSGRDLHSSHQHSRSSVPTSQRRDNLVNSLPTVPEALENWVSFLGGTDEGLPRGTDGRLYSPAAGGDNAANSSRSILKGRGNVSSAEAGAEKKSNKSAAQNQDYEDLLHFRLDLRALAEHSMGMALLLSIISPNLSQQHTSFLDSLRIRDRAREILVQTLEKMEEEQQVWDQQHVAESRTTARGADKNKISSEDDLVVPSTSSSSSSSFPGSVESLLRRRRGYWGKAAEPRERFAALLRENSVGQVQHHAAVPGPISVAELTDLVEPGILQEPLRACSCCPNPSAKNAAGTNSALDQIPTNPLIYPGVSCCRESRHGPAVAVGGSKNSTSLNRYVDDLRRRKGHKRYVDDLRKRTLEAWGKDEALPMNHPEVGRRFLAAHRGGGTPTQHELVARDPHQQASGADSVVVPGEQDELELISIDPDEQRLIPGGVPAATGGGRDEFITFRRWQEAARELRAELMSSGTAAQGEVDLTDDELFEAEVKRLWGKLAPMEQACCAAAPRVEEAPDDPSSSSTSTPAPVPVPSVDLCPICLDPAENDKNRTVVKLPCSHVLHTHCLQDHCRSSSRCPVCRQDFLARGLADQHLFLDLYAKNCRCPTFSGTQLLKMSTSCPSELTKTAMDKLRTDAQVGAEECMRWERTQGRRVFDYGYDSTSALDVVDPPPHLHPHSSQTPSREGQQEVSWLVKLWKELRSEVVDVGGARAAYEGGAGTSGVVPETPAAGVRREPVWTWCRCVDALFRGEDGSPLGTL